MKIYKTKSYWIDKKNKGYFKSGEISSIKSNELVIKTLFSGISYGTEKLVYSGKVPKSQKSLMKCPYQEGDFGTDIKYGYINVGKVVDGAKSYLGSNIFSLYPHQDFYKIPYDDVLVIPKKIPLTRCLLIPNLETAINAVWDTLPSAGDRILVIGAGIVGLLTAYLINKIPGINLFVVDKDSSKSKITKKLGIKFLDTIPKKFSARFIYECTGDHRVLNSIRNNITVNSTICVLSWYGDKKSEIALGENFFSKRAKLIMSQVSKISPTRFDLTNQDRRKIALDILETNDDLDYLVEKKYVNFDHLDKFFSDRKKHNNFLCKVVKY
tara:strand:- start:3207 stop:4181 length:975 start_codon:yes stop_codon:yes gene_type:complete